jgi:hypothetical protein
MTIRGAGPAYRTIEQLYEILVREFRGLLWDEMD